MHLCPSFLLWIYSSVCPVTHPPIHSTTSLSICFSFIHSPIHLPSIQLFTHPTIHTDLCICIVLLNHPLFYPSIPLSCYSSYLWIFITSIKQRYECSTDILIQCFLIRAAVQSYHEHYLSECEVCATSCTASINVFFFQFSPASVHQNHLRTCWTWWRSVTHTSIMYWLHALELFCSFQHFHSMSIVGVRQHCCRCMLQIPTGSFNWNTKYHFAHLNCHAACISISTCYF